MTDGASSGISRCSTCAAPGSVADRLPAEREVVAHREHDGRLEQRRGEAEHELDDARCGRPRRRARRARPRSSAARPRRRGAGRRRGRRPGRRRRRGRDRRGLGGRGVVGVERVDQVLGLELERLGVVEHAAPSLRRARSARASGPARDDRRGGHRRQAGQRRRGQPGVERRPRRRAASRRTSRTAPAAARRSSARCSSRCGPRARRAAARDSRSAGSSASSVAKSCGSSIAAISWRSWTTSGTHLNLNACAGWSSRTAARFARSSIAPVAIGMPSSRPR